MSAKVGVRVLPAAVLLSSLAVPGLADQQQERQGAPLTEAAIRGYLALAADFLERSKKNKIEQTGKDGAKIVAFADFKAKRRLEIPLADARDIILRANYLGLAEKCGLNDLKAMNERALTSRNRNKGWTDRQLALTDQLRLVVVNLVTQRWRVTADSATTVVVTENKWSLTTNCSDNYKAEIRKAVMTYIGQTPDAPLAAPAAAKPAQ
jgi:hypothetical protein